jgi:hypothetical protein
MRSLTSYTKHTGRMAAACPSSGLRRPCIGMMCRRTLRVATTLVGSLPAGCRRLQVSPSSRRPCPRRRLARPSPQQLWLPPSRPGATISVCMRSWRTRVATLSHTFAAAPSTSPTGGTAWTRPTFLARWRFRTRVTDQPATCATHASRRRAGTPRCSAFSPCQTAISLRTPPRGTPRAMRSCPVTTALPMAPPGRQSLRANGGSGIR